MKTTYTVKELKAIVKKAESQPNAKNGNWDFAYMSYSDTDYKAYKAARKQLQKLGEYPKDHNVK